ncbi:MAG TPA: DNA methyltransferase [Aquihabitans sp.]|jgi:hypothetical protein|nr:DNA methyltransferase [Aquihabitans sp.]
MSATYVVADVRDALAALPDGSADLVLTSPPFLALRSYLPSDHPDKGREIGSEPTPAAFLDTLLGLSAEWRRVLAPHGTLAVELGSTYSGGSRKGGDYADGAWRGDQEKFGGSSSSSRESGWSIAQATWLAGVIDTEGYIGVRRQESQRRSPSFQTQVRVTMMERQVVDRCAEVTGVGNVTQDGRGAYSWSANGQMARYVLTNIWPHLLIKKRQAMAGIELQRHIEDTKRRGQYAPLETGDVEYRQMIREYVMGLNARGEERGVYQPEWTPPTPPRIQHSATGAFDGWPLDKCDALIPEMYRLALAYGRNPLTGEESPAGMWRIRNVVRWVRANPPVGALGDKFRCATSDLVVACTSRTRWFDLDAVRTPHQEASRIRATPRPKRHDDSHPGTGWTSARPEVDQNPAGAPPLDWWSIPPGGYKGSHYAVFPPELCRRPIEAMCPRRVCRTCGTPSRRETENPNAGHGRNPWGGQVGEHGFGDRPNVAERLTTGWSSCGCPGTDGLRLDGWHRGNGWRPGLVLDPFGGSGTTGLVATGLGRDALLFDLDARNLDLARERLGMLLAESTLDELGAAA